MLKEFTYELNAKMEQIIKDFIRVNDLASKYENFKEDIVVDKLINDMNEYLNDFGLEDEADAIDRLEEACQFITDLIDNEVIKF